MGRDPRGEGRVAARLFDRGAAALASPGFRLAVFYFAYFAHLGAYVAYFSLWLEARGFSPQVIASVLAVPAVLRIAAPAFWGWFADRLGALLPGGIAGLVALLSMLAAASFAMLSQASDLNAVFAWIALTAFFTSGVLPLVDATALAALGAASGAYGPVRLWGSIGFIASVMAAGAWLERAPVTIVLPLVAVLMLSAALSALALPRGQLGTERRESSGALRKMRDPRVAALFAAAFCMTVAHGALYAFYSIYLVDAAYSTMTVGVLWTLGVLAEIAVFFWLPSLMRRHTLRAILLASFVAAGVRFLAIGSAVDLLVVLVLAQLLHGLTFGSYHAASVAAVHRLFGGALAMRGQALYASLSYGLGGVTGTLLSGWSWAAFGPQVTFAISAAFGALGALLIAWRFRE